MNTEQFADDLDGDFLANSWTCDKDELHRSMSNAAVCEWLVRHNIPYEFSHLFEEQYIDGSEFLQLTEEEVKSICPLGIAIKIIRLLPHLQPVESASSPSFPQPASHDDSGTPISGTPVSSSAPLASSVMPPQITTSQPTVNLGNSQLGSGCSTPTSTGSPTTNGAQSRLLDIPKLWRPDVNDCIANKTLTDTARDEMVRRLVDNLFSMFEKPSRTNCVDLARKLILTYPWMRDDGLGPSHSSWVEKMVTRIRNVIKGYKKRSGDDNSLAPSLKRSRKSNKLQLQRRYPVNPPQSQETIDNPVSIAVHFKGLETEMKKSNPRDHLLLPLMKSTFLVRRDWIVQGDADCVTTILEKYSALSRQSVIEQELDLIMENHHFLENWSSKYVPAILLYSSRSAKGSVKKLMEGIEQIGPEGKEQRALLILYECWKSRNQTNTLNFFYEKFEEDERSMEELCRLAPTRTSPRIIEVLKSEGMVAYSECSVLCKTQSFRDALYFCFAAYYVFNLEYPKTIYNMLCFFQECIFNYPLKRSSSYVAIVTDINKYVFK